MNKDGYDIIEGVKDKETRKKYWNMAVGLQQIDDLKPSEYLKELARKNIEGDISNQEIEHILYDYYAENIKPEERTKECDIVSNRIVELLEYDGIVFNPTALKSIHKYLFHDIYETAGEFRKFNISKKEPILNGRTVKYANYFMIEDTLSYDFIQEKGHDYGLSTTKEVSAKIARFTSSIWQVHPFMEGNTRTTAVFIERYLNSVGFHVNNELFEQKAKYFRNALVRSNYADYTNGIDSTDEFLKMFFDNLLFGGKNQLNSRNLIIKEYFHEKDSHTSEVL